MWTEILFPKEWASGERNRWFIAGEKKSGYDAGAGEDKGQRAFPSLAEEWSPSYQRPTWSPLEPAEIPELLW